MSLIRKKSRPVLSKYLMATRRRTSPLLDGFLPDREKRWLPMLKRPMEQSFPSLDLRQFSFLTNPAETMKALKAVAELECTRTSAYLHFEDDFCLDAGAYLVLAEIWPQMAGVFRGGRMKPPVQKVLNATGVGHNNNMSLPAVAANPDGLDETGQPDIWPFPLQRRRPAGTSKSSNVHIEPQDREKVLDRFCKAVNEWLGVPAIDLELTSVGMGWIGTIIGEVLDNAERHSQATNVDGDWSVTAFMAKRTEDGNDVYRCYMAFLSVGRSIAESLQDAASDIREKMDGYMARHWRCGRSPETLATVFALQDMVTCDPAARASHTGGTGLMEMLDMVGFLGGAGEDGMEPRVTIISGKSCIMLKPPYIKGVRLNDDPTTPRVQWCNATNSSDHPPDDVVAFDLEEHFAGTLISVAFTLDPVYLATESESNDDSDN